MIEMQPQRDHRDDVKESDPPHAKARHEIGEYIFVSESARRAPAWLGEMQDVQRNENQQKHAAPSHCARCDRAYLWLTLDVTNRASCAVLHRELISSHNVQNHCPNQHEAHNPQKLASALEKMRVCVDRFGTAK